MWHLLMRRFCSFWRDFAFSIQQAEDTIHLFTKDSEGTANNLFEMQVSGAFGVVPINCSLIWCLVHVVWAWNGNGAPTVAKLWTCAQKGPECKEAHWGNVRRSVWFSYLLPAQGILSQLRCILRYSLIIFLPQMTLRSYIALLRLEDRIFSHPYLFRAVFIAIEVYLTLADQAPVSCLCTICRKSFLYQ